MKKEDLSLALGVIPFVVILIVWQLASGTIVSTVYLPPASKILDELLISFTGGNHLYDLPANTLLTLERMTFGYLIALSVGVPTGIAIGLNSRVSKLLEPTTEVFRVLPGVAIIPFFILLIGINDSMYIAFVAFGAVWPILINTIDGVKSVEPLFFDVAKSFKIQGLKKFRKITLYGASPYIFSGMRTSLLLALLITVAAEIVTGHNGLGFSVYSAMEFSNVTMLYAEIFLVGIIGFLLNIVFMGVESRLMGWHKSLRKG